MARRRPAQLGWAAAHCFRCSTTSSRVMWSLEPRWRPARARAWISTAWRTAKAKRTWRRRKAPLARSPLLLRVELNRSVEVRCL